MSSNTTSQFSWQDAARRISGLTLCPIGIISSLLILVSLRRKVFKISDSNLFFALMFTISFLDLLFNCGYIYIKCVNASESLIKCIFYGLVYSVSLTSDLCALTLTAERYASICWPQQMQNLSRRKAISIRIIAATLIVVVGLMRLQYVFEFIDLYLPDFEYLPKNSGPLRSSIYLALSIFSDVALPFILVITMSSFRSGLLEQCGKEKRKKRKKWFHRQAMR